MIENSKKGIEQGELMAQEFFDLEEREYNKLMQKKPSNETLFSLELLSSSAEPRLKDDCIRAVFLGVKPAAHITKFVEELDIPWSDYGLKKVDNIIFNEQFAADIIKQYPQVFPKEKTIEEIFQQFKLELPDKNNHTQLGLLMGFPYKSTQWFQDSENKERIGFHVGQIEWVNGINENHEQDIQYKKILEEAFKIADQVSKQTNLKT